MLNTDIGRLLTNATAPVQTPAVQTGLVGNMQFDVDVVTAPDVTLQTSLAQGLQADANLRLRGTLSNPVLLGRIELLRSLRDRDVPLHAVGLQAHLFASRALDRDGLQALLAEIAALKLDVLITELDVIDYDLPANVGERDAMVAGMAGRFLESVRDVIRPKAILTWGLSDRYTWVPIYFKRPDGMPNRPLPFDADLKRKPLFDVIEEFRRKA